MTKEKLEKEAEEKFKVNNNDKDREHFYDRMWFKTGYLAGAEPREKRIAELEATNKRISDECHKLVDSLEKIQSKNAELKARVEKRDTDILTLKGLTERQRIKFEKETTQRIYNFNKSIEWKEKHRVLKKENAKLKTEVERLRLNEQLAINNGKLWLNENAKLKKEYSDNLSLKDEELMCLETEFNTYKSEAKDHIKKLLDCLKQDTSDPQTNYYVCQYMDKAEQFLKEI